MAVEADRHGIGDIGLAGLVDLVEKLEKALAFQFWKDFAHRSPDEVGAANDRDIGVVDIGINVLRAAEDAGEARHLLQHDLLPEAFLAGASFSQDLLRRFDDNGHDAGRLAILIGYRRIVEVHPRLLGRAVTVEG